MIAAANPNEETPDEKPGGGGALFQRPDNFRSDARLAAQMITLGVVTLEQAQALLRAGYKLAMKSAKAGRAREYAACMKIGLEVAKLEQNERHKDSTASAGVTNQQINIYLPSNGRETQVLPSMNGNGNGKH